MGDFAGKPIRKKPQSAKIMDDCVPAYFSIAELEQLMDLNMTMPNFLPTSYPYLRDQTPENLRHGMANSVDQEQTQPWVFPDDSSAIWRGPIPVPRPFGEPDGQFTPNPCTWEDFSDPNAMTMPLSLEVTDPGRVYPKEPLDKIRPSTNDLVESDPGKKGRRQEHMEPNFQPLLTRSAKISSLTLFFSSSFLD